MGAPDPAQRERGEDITADSQALLRRTRIPLRLDFVDDFIYDASEDAFLDEDGHHVMPAVMLQYAYDQHCGTYRLAFAVRWRIGSQLRAGVRSFVWRGQDALLWLLLRRYDVELVTTERVFGSLLRKDRSLLHKYTYSDFRRTTEPAGDRSHFFGFQSSRKSFFSNMLVLAFACTVVYFVVPRWGFLTAIYRNPALTTAALVFGFLLADVLGPWLLITGVCALSRLRPGVMFFRRNVRV